MNRRQRSALRKTRRRYFVFSLLACFLIFLSGVYITYDVMMEVTSIPKDDSIFSFNGIGQALNGIFNSIENSWIKELTANIFNLCIKLSKLLKDLVNRAVDRI